MTITHINIANYIGKAGTIYNCNKRTFNLIIFVINWNCIEKQNLNICFQIFNVSSIFCSSSHILSRPDYRVGNNLFSLKRTLYIFHISKAYLCTVAINRHSVFVIKSNIYINRRIKSCKGCKLSTLIFKRNC